MTTRIGARTVLPMMVVTLFVSACDTSLLEVDDPDVITPDDVQGETAAQLFWAGGLGQFARAFSSGSDGQVAFSGLAADEFHSADTDPGLHAIDRRDLGDRSVNLLVQYRLLHQARVGLRNAAELLEANLPGDSRIAEMWSLNGFTHLLFAENYCSGVPLSHTPIDGDVIYAPRSSTADVLTLAVQRFQTAATAAGSNADQLHLAAVGLARAYLNQGAFAQAAAAVAAVPDGWEYLIRSRGGADLDQANSVYHNNFERGGWSLSDAEGSNGVAFRSADDSRVPWQDSGGAGLDRATPLFHQLKYDSRDADVVLASGVEARLIEAEADLNGAATEWLTILNDLRAAEGLGSLSDPGSQSARVDLLFEERARWLFGTAHRLGDLRRLVRQYGRDQAAVFPSGAYFRGGNYAADVSFPIPVEELQNPELADVTGPVCLNRDA
jgi:starch-binding outer membrane protein, SusD/RagB family